VILSGCLLDIYLECISGNTADVELWNFLLHKISIYRNLAMCNKKISLQVGKIWKFALAEIGEMYIT